MAGLKRITLVFVMLFLIGMATAACSTEDARKTSLPSPSAVSHRVSGKPATPTPATEAIKPPAPSATSYQAGDKPFAGMQAGNISRIRMIVLSDAQPPYFPHPFKDATAQKDINAITGILNGIQLQKKIQLSEMPVGATGYSLLVNEKDGTLSSIYLFGDHILSEPGIVYNIARLPDLDAAFQALGGHTRLLPGTADTMEAENGCLFTMGGWSYYLEPCQGSSGCLAREDSSGTVQVIDKLVNVIHPAIFPGQSRIVLVENAQAEGSQITSIKPDGSNRKTLKAKGGIIDMPLWDGDDNCLYYMGWTKDLKYPRPLYRVDENLTKTKEAMDIPGQLLAVKGGDVYCLSTDGKSVVSLPAGTVKSAFDSAIENLEYAQGRWILYGKNGGTFFWTVEGGAVPAPKN